MNIRLQPLNEEEQAIVQNLTAYNETEDEGDGGGVRLSFPNVKISLNGRDLARTKNVSWFNDELINSGVGLINDRCVAVSSGFPIASLAGDGDIEADVAVGVDQDVVVGGGREEVDVGNGSLGIGPKSRLGERRCFMLNSFFYSRICSSPEGYDYDGVRRWPKRAEVNICDLNLVLFPMKIGNAHWVLSVIDLQAREIVYYDSLRLSDGRCVLEHIRTWLFDEISNVYSVGKAGRMDVGNWPFLNRSCEVPLQQDGGSCGVYVIYLADYLTLRKAPDYGHENIRVQRDRFVLFLRDKTLPTH